LAPGPVWIGAENLAPTGIRFPDRPARSQSLYQLSYPVHECRFDNGQIREVIHNSVYNILLYILYDIETCFGSLKIHRLAMENNSTMVIT
jgi:hypothetical protein